MSSLKLCFWGFDGEYLVSWSTLGYFFLRLSVNPKFLIFQDKSSFEVVFLLVCNFLIYTFPFLRKIALGLAENDFSPLMYYTCQCIIVVKE